MFFERSSNHDCHIIEQNFLPKDSSFEEKMQYSDCMEFLYGVSNDVATYYWTNVVNIFFLSIFALFLVRYVWEKGSQISFENLCISFLEGSYIPNEDEVNVAPIRERIPTETTFNQYIHDKNIVSLFIGSLLSIVMFALILFSLVLSIFFIVFITITELRSEREPYSKNQIVQNVYYFSEDFCESYIKNYYTEGISIGDKLLYTDCFNQIYPKFIYFSFILELFVWLFLNVILVMLFLTWKSRFKFFINLKITLAIAFISVMSFFYTYLCLLILE